MTQQEYSHIVKRNSPNSPFLKNCLSAFLAGGAICALGQGILELFMFFGLSRKDAGTLESVTLIFLGILFTALHLYDRLARHAGAGTLVPITGFANSMSSPAIEFRAEGFISGIGTKLFAISGPVIVYGTLAAALYGAGYYIIGLMF